MNLFSYSCRKAPICERLDSLRMLILEGPLHSLQCGPQTSKVSEVWPLCTALYETEREEKASLLVHRVDVSWDCVWTTDDEVLFATLHACESIFPLYPAHVWGRNRRRANELGKS
jgi:hypothetical protein